MMEKLPDAFNDAANVTRSHVEAANALAQIQLTNNIASIPPPKAKRGRPPGARDAQPRQKRTATTGMVKIHPDGPPTSNPSLQGKNNEISVHYMHTGMIWSWESTEVNDLFAFNISQEITNETPDPVTKKTRLAPMGECY